MFLPSDFIWEHRIEIIAKELGIMFTFQPGYSAEVFGLCDWLSRWCLGPCKKYLSLYVGWLFGKSILKKLVCKLSLYFVLLFPIAPSHDTLETKYQWLNNVIWLRI